MPFSIDWIISKPDFASCGISVDSEEITCGISAVTAVISVGSWPVIALSTDDVAAIRPGSRLETREVTFGRINGAAVAINEATPLIVV